MKKLIVLSSLLALGLLAARPASAQAVRGENIVVPKEAQTTQLPGGKTYATTGNRQSCVTADPKHALNGASGDCDGACLTDASGKAACMGSCTWVDRDGDLAFFTWTGQAEGGWKLDGGTGKWQAATGTGTWKGAALAAGNFGRNNWEGTITMKK